MIYCIADESYRRLDNKIARTIVCIVEFSNLNLITKEFEELLEIIEKDKVRFKNRLNKLHSSGVAAPEITYITEYISKMRINAKIYTKYIYDKSEKECKIETMHLAVNHITRLHKNKELFIEVESANEYINSDLSKLFGNLGNKFALLPDIILTAFLHTLDSESLKKSNNLNYNLLKEKIRLQVFALDKSYEYLDKTKRL